MPVPPVTSQSIPGPRHACCSTLPAETAGRVEQMDRPDDICWGAVPLWLYAASFHLESLIWVVGLQGGDDTSTR